MSETLAGFGNYFTSEAIPGALPTQQNSPQRCPEGLYAEQLSGTAFTAPRHENRFSWLYRRKPSVVHGDYQRFEGGQPFTTPLKIPSPPNQLRWSPLKLAKDKTFLDGIEVQASNEVGAIYRYAFDQSMGNTFFYSADGDWLFVVEIGTLRIKTEFGVIEAAPCEIAHIPRGVKWQVECIDESARGYILENRGAALTLPGLGPIGANGLAYPRHFEHPHAAYEDLQGKFQLIAKYNDHLWQAELNHSPLDVVAWHGNLVPFKYNLKLFNTINTVSFDHPDPSIFTVLTSPSNQPGTANIDFVIFPERWMVAEGTFRPPYYHRNVMSEYMGLLQGAYDAKTDDGFKPGGASLHNCMSPHGPDAASARQAMDASLEPVRYRDTLAFMFESRLPWLPTESALTCPTLQKNYLACWQGL